MADAPESLPPASPPQHEPFSGQRSVATAAVIFGLLTMLARFTPVYDPDYFWHLATGQWIVQRGTIPFQDVFSHTYAGKPLQFVDAAADVLMYLLYRVAEDAGPIVLFTALGGAAVAVQTWTSARLVAQHLPQWGRSSWAVWPMAGLVAASTIFRNSPRPQTLTFALFAGLLALLHLPVRPGREMRRWWAIAVLVAVWQNLHASAVVAVLAVAAAVAGETLALRLSRANQAWLTGHRGASLLVACLLALLLTPRPVERLAAGFAHLGDPRVPAILFEWAPIWRDGLAPLQMAWGQAWLILVVLASAGLLFKDVRQGVPARLWFTGGGFAVMGAQSVRFVPIAALAMAPLALATITWLLQRTSRSVAMVLVAALTLSSVGLAADQRRPLGVGIAQTDFPVGAAAFLAKEQPKGNLYNDFFDGGYLLWSLQGRYPVFVDGRAMALYGIEFVEQVYNPKPGTWLRLWTRFDVGVAVVHNDQRLREVQALPGWSVVYVDDRAFVAVRDSDNPELAARLGIRHWHPADTAGDFAQWRAQPSLLPQAQAEAQRQMTLAPQASISHVLRATIALAQAEANPNGQTLALQEAAEAAHQALTLRPTGLPALRTAAMVCQVQNDPVCACRYAGAVLQRVPKQAVASAIWQQMQCAAQPVD